MPEENAEIVRRAFDAFGRGDMDTILRLCDEEILIVQPPELPGVPPRQHGHEGVIEAFSYWPDQWDDFRVEVLDVIADAGGYVVVRTRQSGRGRQSGVDVDLELTFAFAVRDGKIAEWRIYLDRSKVVEATGLSE